LLRSFPHHINLLGCIIIALLLTLTQAQAQQQLPGTGPNYETRLSSIEDQLRTLTGKVEELDYATRRLDQSLQRLQTDYDARISKLETAVQAQATAVATPVVPPATQTPPPPTNIQTQQQPASSETAPTEANGTLGAIKMQDGRVTGAVNNPQAPPLPNTPPDYGLTAQEQYDRAFSLLREANYDEAEKAFKIFIDKNPQDKLIDNAKYWYGETFYVRGKFNDAAVAFADAYQQNPKGTKAPDSLLKMAMSLNAVGKTDDACATLESLKNKYPNAPTTVRSRAEQERAQMNCGKN